MKIAHGPAWITPSGGRSQSFSKFEADRPPSRSGSFLIPPDNDAVPSPWARFSVFLFLFIPWLLVYESVTYRGPLPGAFETYLPGEKWPIWQWTEILYVSPYLLVTLAPLVAPTNRVLKRFIISAYLASGFVFFLFFTLPALALPRPFEPVGILGRMMVLDRELDRNNGTAAFPSFHVVWSFLGAAVWVQRMPRCRHLWWLWAVLVSASCLTTGVHAIVDLVAGFVVFVLAHHHKMIRQLLASQAMPTRRRGPAPSN